jgi:hypothetical protein
VGYRLLQKNGWKAGQGLGKDGDGITEPLKVWKKGDRRGVGGESKSSGHVVGDKDNPGNAAKPNKGNKGNKAPGGKAAAGCGDDDDDDEVIVMMSKDQMAEHVKKTARDKSIHTQVFRAFKEEEPEVDMNPLLRRRKEQEEAERRKIKRKRERGGGGGGGGGDAGGMSANNPLRGLW